MTPEEVEGAEIVPTTVEIIAGPEEDDLMEILHPG